MTERVYKKNIVGILTELADKTYQARTWAIYNKNAGMTILYAEAICMLFDDCIVGDLLKNNEVIFDLRSTEAFRELERAIDAVDDDRSPEEIINDPLMQIVREKAAECLALIQASDGKESTVEIIE